MRITASINVSKDNIKWSKLATHNQRKTANHSNQNINDNMSKYNGYYQLMDYYKLNLKMIKQSNAKNHWLDARNKKYKSRGQYKYVETPQELAKKATKKGQNSRNIVVQLGNTQSKKKLINRLRKQKLSKSEQAKVINKTFRDYAEKFNRTHLHNGHGLAITDLDVHNDEKTIHAHGRLVSFYQAKDKHKPAHYTKSGNFKPAKVKKGALKFGFSRGVKAEYGGSTPRVAFKRFRSYEDNQIVRSFSRSLNQSLELTRTGGITNYTRQEQSMAASYQDQAHSLVSSSIHDFSISMTNREVKDSKAESAISSDRQAVNEQVAKQNQQKKLFKQYKINRINQLKKIKKQIKQEKQNYKDWHVKETREQRKLKQQKKIIDSNKKLITNQKSVLGGIKTQINKAKSIYYGFKAKNNTHKLMRNKNIIKQRNALVQGFSDTLTKNQSINDKKLRQQRNNQAKHTGISKFKHGIDKLLGNTPQQRQVKSYKAIYNQNRDTKLSKYWSATTDNSLTSYGIQSYRDNIPLSWRKHVKSISNTYGVGVLSYYQSVVPSLNTSSASASRATNAQNKKRVQRQKAIKSMHESNQAQVATSADMNMEQIKSLGKELNKSSQPTNTRTAPKITQSNITSYARNQGSGIGDN